MSRSGDERDVGAGSSASGVPPQDVSPAGIEPVVDVVVAVHTTARPIARAVGSVLATAAPVRITVVCHHVAPAEVDALLDDVRARLRATPHQLRLLALDDGTRSPSGPFNLGLDEATAPFVAIMGSDDALEPGAVDSWLARQREHDADAVVPRLRHGRVEGAALVRTAAGALARLGLVGSDAVPTPPARPGRRRVSGVRDRLAYRSAPLGLVRRETLEALALRMVPGLGVGEDVAFSTRLWLEARVVLDRRGPAYLIGPDAADRVTFAHKPAAAELACVTDLLAQPWFARLPAVARRAVAVKLARIHVCGAVHNRPDPARWTSADLDAFVATVTALDAAAPGYAVVLSRADRDLLDALAQRGGAARAPGAAATELLALSRRRRRHGTPVTLLPRDPRQVLAREAPLRVMVASVLARLG